MRLLLDTKAWVWWLTDNPLLSDEARRLLVDNDNEVFVSVASIWELAFKSPTYVCSPSHVLGELETWAAQDGFQMLSIGPAHAIYPVGKRMNLNDPFDLIIVGQAHTHQFTVVTDNIEPFRRAGCDVIDARQITVRGRSGGRGERLRSSRPTE